MRASLNWLRRHADLPADPREIASRLTMAGFVVASVEPMPTAAGPDVALDIEVTFNRPDLLSHAGIARELAGVFGTPLKPQDSRVPEGKAIPDHVPVRVDAAELCPLYTARVVRGVRVGPSPAWMSGALEAAGVRSVSNVVDVTNWVMLETGQPLHAFDLAKLRGPEVVVRRARGESFTSIDGTKLDPGPDDLAICDVSGPAALAGVMGALHTEVSAATRDVLLESAVFAPLSVRATARRLQLRSESSHRFERFVDVEGTVAASDLAARLLIEVCGATGVGPVTAVRAQERTAPSPIRLRTSRVAHVLGLAVAEEEIRSILRSLALEERPRDGADVTTWVAPSWRPDLAAEIDLIEEVARRVGFDRVPDSSALSVRPVQAEPLLEVRRRVRETLVRCGLRECVSAPFIGEGPHDLAFVVDAPPLRVLNPMRSDENLLRRSLAGPLLAAAGRNAERGIATVRLFEDAPVYATGAADGTAGEAHLAAGLVSGTYADAKGCVEAVLEALGVRGARFERGAPRPLRRDRSAVVKIGGRLAGVVGELPPRGAAKYGLGGPVALFELRLDALVAAARLEPDVRAVSRYPAVERDLAWVVPESVEWSTIEDAAREAGAPLVRSVEFLSEFRGAQVGGGRKSIAFRMELRADDRTLTGADADACIGRVVERLRRDPGGEIRA